jgi:hypothetical protein
MITKDDAVRIVGEHLNRGAGGPYAGDDELLVDDAWTIEREYGWLFSYNRAAYFRTKNRRDGLVGNGPILVRRDDGAVIEFSSAYSNEQALAEYEADPEKFRPVEPPSGS